VKKFKKIALYTLGSIVALFVVLMIVSLVVGPPATDTSPNTESAEDAYYDPQLESLRERNAELDDVYQRDEQRAGSFPEGEGDNPFAEVGELSDFDSFGSEEETFAEDSSLPQDAIDPQSENDVIEAEGTLSPDENFIDAMNEDSDVADPFADVSSSERDVSTPDESSWDGQPVNNEQTANRNTSPGRSVSGEQLEEVRTSLDSKIESLKSLLHSELSRHQVELLEAQSNSADSESLNHLQREMQLINTQLAALSEHSESLTTTLASVQADVTEMKTQRDAIQRQAARPQRPSATTLRNLYKLQRIEGATATMIGQNTGDTYTFRQGDSIAYGGRVGGISGDTVTLTWGDISTKLSIF
jgi:hypothetical protein